MPVMQRGLACFDLESLRDLGEAAHRLAGNTALLGLSELEPALRRLERESADKPDHDVLEELAMELDRDLSEIPSWLALRAQWGQS